MNAEVDLLERARRRVAEELPRVLEEFHVPGAAVGLDIRGAAADVCAGVTSLENALPVTDRTIFQIGSISKTMLGVVAAGLVAQGGLDLDAPVAGVVADVARLDPRITLRHLLTHRSGIDSQHMIGRAREHLADGADDRISAALPHVAGDPLMFEPGADYSYSGPGFMVAAAVIERTAGGRWRDILATRLLVPADLTTTFTTADEAITYRVAAPHDVRRGSAYLSRDEGWQLHWQLPGWDVPGGGVLSCVADLLTYSRYVQQHATELPYWDRLADRGSEDLGIAYAWMLDDRRGHRTVHHDGLTAGYASRLVIYPDLGITVVMLTNSAKGGRAINRIERLVSDVVLGEVPAGTARVLPLDAYAGAVGRYDCGFYGQVVVRIRDDARGYELIAEPAVRNDGSYTIDPLSAPLLLPVEGFSLTSDPTTEFPDAVVHLRRNTAGDIDGLRIHDRIAARVGDR